MMVGRGDNIGPDKCHYERKQFGYLSSSGGWAGIRWLVSVCVFMCVVVSPCGAIRFTGERETYSKFPLWNACVNASIQFEFKTVQRDALLMYTDKNNRYDYLQVILTEGSVLLWINFRSESDQNLTINLGKNLNDGKWHSVEVKRNRMETTLQVDKTQYSKVAFGSDDDAYIDRIEKHNFMYFGGLPVRYADTFGREALPTAVKNSQFEGEIRNIMYFNCSCLPTR
ncbi:unnamed protein product [Lymnaea stagnalis]|uniref:Laminin G domain-containing protein n=1 Tax=Lymnaea stagnalis TaxID=6523 RepID=A0AAV2IQI1_LYMST